MSAVGTPSLTHRSLEIRFAPAPETGLRIGRDVRAVERPEGRLQRAPAGERNGALLVFRVTADAAACLGEIFAALCVALRQRRAPCEPEEQRRKKQEPRQGGAQAFLRT